MAAAQRHSLSHEGSASARQSAPRHAQHTHRMDCYGVPARARRPASTVLPRASAPGSDAAPVRSAPRARACVRVRVRVPRRGLVRRRQPAAAAAAPETSTHTNTHTAALKALCACAYQRRWAVRERPCLCAQCLNCCSELGTPLLELHVATVATFYNCYSLNPTEFTSLRPVD